MTDNAMYYVAIVHSLIRVWPVGDPVYRCNVVT